jgi:sensor histidine kinase YesM
LLTVSDDAGRLTAEGHAARPGGSGIGVRNLRERLQGLYGERASLSLLQMEPAGVSAQMRLPCAS